MLIDSHCHITDPKFDGCRDALIEEIRASGVAYIFETGSDLITSRTALEAAEKYDFVYAVVGCHPHEAEGFGDAQLGRIREMCSHPKVRAIGEIGLDYHYDLSPRDVQKYWFGRQVDLALELGMPIVIHEREAAGDVFDILTEHGAFSKERIAQFPAKPDGSPDARVYFHCFAGSAEMARQYVKLGASFGVDGPVTYKNARKTIEVVEQTDLVHFHVETDCPYLTPVPFRGTVNKPTYVEYPARKIAEIKNISFEEVCRVTSANALRFFGLTPTE